MGTDIHIYAEIFKDGKWKKLDVEVPSDKNYWSFAILANVRNGHGFAGSDTGESVPFIDDPRGIPEDTSIRDSDGIEFESKDYIWLGDHSHSWVLLSELMAVNLELKHIKRGFVPKEEIKRIEKEGGTPNHSCSGVFGPRSESYAELEWCDYLKNSAWLIPKIIEKLKPLGLPDKIRLVFGFDS